MNAYVTPRVETCIKISRSFLSQLETAWTPVELSMPPWVILSPFLGGQNMPLPLAFILETDRSEIISYLVGSPIPCLFWIPPQQESASPAPALKPSICKEAHLNANQNQITSPRLKCLQFSQRYIVLLWQSWNHSFQLSEFRKCYKQKYWREINILILFWSFAYVVSGSCTVSGKSRAESSTSSRETQMFSFNFENCWTL